MSLLPEQFNPIRRRRIAQQKQSEIVIDNPHPLLEDPAAMNRLAKHVYQVATDSLANHPDRPWVSKVIQGNPITARSEYICVYVNKIAEPLVHERLGPNTKVEYFEYVQSYKPGRPLVPSNRRYPEQSFLIVRPEQPGQPMYLLDFQYLQLTKPQRRSLFFQSFRSTTPLPDCMVIKFSSLVELEQGLDAHNIRPEVKHFYTNLFHPDTQPRPSYGYQGSNTPWAALKKL